MKPKEKLETNELDKDEQKDMDYKKAIESEEKTDLLESSELEYE